MHSKVRCTAEGGVRSEVQELLVERRGRGLLLRHTGSGREVRHLHLHLHPHPGEGGAPHGGGGEARG